jgi:hypothetical protein
MAPLKTIKIDASQLVIIITLLGPPSTFVDNPKVLKKVIFVGRVRLDAFPDEEVDVCADTCVVQATQNT